MLNMASGMMPRNRKLANKVWVEMNQQISNYIRGKVLEIIIVGTVSYITFAILDLVDYLQLVLSDVKCGRRHGRAGGGEAHDDCFVVVDGDVVLGFQREKSARVC